jgi:hypothetical protein
MTSSFSLCRTTRGAARPLLRPDPWEGQGGVELHPSTPAQSARTKATSVSEQAPSLCHAEDKTRPPSDDDKYGEPPSKYGSMGRAYGPTHYGMGLTMTALTFKANRANKGHDPKARDRGHRHHDQQDNQVMMMTKATTRPCRTGRLANHHRANSVVTTGTVAPRHHMPRRGHKTMTTTMLGRTLMPKQDDLPCKPR